MTNSQDNYFAAARTMLRDFGFLESMPK